MKSRVKVEELLKQEQLSNIKEECSSMASVQIESISAFLQNAKDQMSACTLILQNMDKAVALVKQAVGSIQ